MEWRGAASSMSETTSFSKLSLAVLSGLREHPWFHFSTDGGGCGILTVEKVASETDSNEIVCPSEFQTQLQVKRSS